MADPRESKLPKWAQEQFEAMRTRAALAWPTVPKPAPDYVCRDGFWHGGAKPSDCELWRVDGGSGLSDFTVRAVRIDAHGYERTGSGSFGSRPNGDYWASYAGAVAAAWWRQAERSARALRTLQRMHPKGGE